MKRNLTVVILFDSSSMREKGVEFCNQLIGRFWSSCEFEVHWWSFSELHDLPTSVAATAKVAKANLLVFAISPQSELPQHFKDWVETWVPQRTYREGAMIALNDPGALPGIISNDTFVYFRNVAHRTGMDYLTECPQELVSGMPDSLDSYGNRAAQVTTVLSGILHKPMTPTRLLSQ